MDILYKIFGFLDTKKPKNGIYYLYIKQIDYIVKIDIAGLKIDAVTKEVFLAEVRQRMKDNKKTFVTTLYSEFLYAAMRDKEVLEMLNKADLAVADGIGMMWAAKFLQMPFTVTSYYGKIFQAFWQMVYSGAMILLKPSWIKSILPEKIVGADLIWDLAKIAAEEHLSVYLLGGFGYTPDIVAERLKMENPNLIIAGSSSKNPQDSTVVEDIKNAHADMVFVAFGPLRQERWTVQNMQHLPARLYIGLGGTFDYIAGKRPVPPRFIRQVGLEWLYRLITQPSRFRRIYHAVFGLIASLIRHKVFSSMPYRKNAVSVVINKDHTILVARYNSHKPANAILGYPQGHFDNWWQLPQGGIEDGEDVVEGAKRELWEEAAIRNVELVHVSPDAFRYEWIFQRKTFVGRRYQFKGQIQSLVYFAFKGPDKEIVLDTDELLEYKWVPWQELGQILSKKNLAEIVKKEISSGLVKLP